MEHGVVSKWLQGKTFDYPEINSALPDSINYEESFESYLSDGKCVSSGGLKMLMDKSPAHFVGWLSGLSEELDEEESEKDHFRFGRALHCFVLEPERFKQMYVVEPVFSGLTKDGRESARSKEAMDAKAAWYRDLPPGTEVVTEKEKMRLLMMIDQIMAHPQVSNFFTNGTPEVSLRATDPETGIRMRIRPDYLSSIEGNDVYIFDIKSTRATTQKEFEYQANKLKYYVSAAMYFDVVKQKIGREPRAFGLIGVSKVYPYDVFLLWLDDDSVEIGALEVGRRWYKEGLRNLKKSITTGYWPSRSTEGSFFKLTDFSYEEPFPVFEWPKEDNQAIEGAQSGAN